MNSNTKILMTTLVVFTLVIGCFAAISPASAAPAKNNSNQDFTGTPIYVTAPTEDVIVDDSVQISITIKNIADRGLPDISIFVNDECKQCYSEIGKGKSVTYTFDVDTSLAGGQLFNIAVWTRLGNKNFQDELYNEQTTVIVIAPEELSMVDKFNDAIKNGEFFGNGPIVFVIDGVSYDFTSKSGNYNGKGSSLFCSIDGVEYRLERNNASLLGVYIN